ncbi:MAG: T9SS type A sorting domain-containing protein [Taibaiella sp.]|jgi:hypothetical protein
MIKSTMAGVHKRWSILPLCLLMFSANVETQAQQQAIPAPSGSGAFGTSVVVLSNGNYVVTDPLFDDGALADVGAVYLYDGSTHAIISTLKGNTTGTQAGSGGITAIANGNFVVGSPTWSDGITTRLGAATFVNGTTGLNGIISSSNSLVGSTADDSVGRAASISVLNNDNYVVVSPRWDDGSIANAGAVTWADGNAGITGSINSSNSLVGSKANDQIGSHSQIATVAVDITKLTNGNYVVESPLWDNGAIVNAGASTWCNGAGGTVGPITSSNSLVGSKANDNVGSYVASGNLSPDNNGATALVNGNYVVGSPNWDNGSIVNAGAATWGNGTTGVTGVINSSNSLIGSFTNDGVSFSRVTPLANGNYVVRSEGWNSVGAVTWGNGTTGTTGTINSSNSLVGSTAGDLVGLTGTALPNGNYVLGSFFWNNTAAISDAGAITWFDGNGATTGIVSSSNSMVGSAAGDRVGRILVVLTNGNYVSWTPNWSSGTTAVTWGSGTVPLTGTVSSGNSLVGSGGNVFILNLTNGNYVVTSPSWDNGTIVDAGAATWGNGTTGITGLITSANSLVGTKINDNVGYRGTALANGNYVMTSPNWDNGSLVDVGAVTWCNGITGATGSVNSSNSLIGSKAGDNISSGYFGVIALNNSNYLVTSPNWDNGTITNAGAVTFGNGTGGTIGPVSICNSLVGTTLNENMGNVVPMEFTNGKYITGTSNWDNGTNLNVGVRIIGDAASTLTGTVNGCSSIPGIAGTNTFQTQAYNATYDYTLVKNSSTNTVIAYYGNGTNQTIANHLDSSYTAACTIPASFVTNIGCRVAGGITPNGASPVAGAVKVKTWIEPSVPIYSGQPYVARHIDVAPVTNPSTATGKVTLYFTQQEFTDFNAHPGSTLDLPTGPGDAAGIANLRIGKYSGTSYNGTGLPGTYFNGGVTLIDPADADIIWNAVKSWWEVSFDMTGSGGLIVQTFTTPLPLDLLEFSGTLRNDDAILNWKTENEDHTSGYDIERSADGKSYTPIGFVSSANRPGINYYTFTDRNVSALHINEIYYRLKQKDMDSRYKYSQVVRLSLSGKNAVALYPNPANMEATLSISLAKADQLQVRILDNIGRTVQQQQVFISSGTTTMNLDLSKLASGVYYVELRGNMLNERKQIVKQ